MNFCNTLNSLKNPSDLPANLDIGSACYQTHTTKLYLAQSIPDLPSLLFNIVLMNNFWMLLCFYIMWFLNFMVWTQQFNWMSSPFKIFRKCVDLENIKSFRSSQYGTTGLVVSLQHRMQVWTPAQQGRLKDLAFQQVQHRV